MRAFVHRCSLAMLACDVSAIINSMLVRIVLQRRGVFRVAHCVFVICSREGLAASRCDQFVMQEEANVSG